MTLKYKSTQKEIQKSTIKESESIESENKAIPIIYMKSASRNEHNPNTILDYLKTHCGPKVDAKSLFDELTTNYVLAKDIEAISKVTKRMNIAVSFRDAGKYSLDQLAAGAGAKGHKILEKTIKPSSVGKAFEDYSKDTGKDFKTYLKETYFEGIEGLVAQWEKEKIAGLYLTTKGKSHFNKIDNYKDKIENYNGIPVLCFEGLSLDEIRDIPFASESGEVSTRDDNSNWHAYFFTGDYDMHDLYQHTSQGSTVPSDSRDESNIIESLCVGMSGEDKIESEYMRIQHGPQVNYIAHNLGSEPGEKIVSAVAKLAKNVAMCDRGIWSVLHSEKEIIDWYAKRGKSKLKSTWHSDLETSKHKLSDYIEDVNGLNDIYDTLLYSKVPIEGSEKKHKNLNDINDKYMSILDDKEKKYLFGQPKGIPNFSDLLYEINKANETIEENKKREQKIHVEIFDEANVRNYILEIEELYKYQVFERVWKSKVYKEKFIKFLCDEKPFNILRDKDRDALIRYFINLRDLEGSEYEENLKKLNWAKVRHFVVENKIIMKN